jgi:hypothetical protein
VNSHVDDCADDELCARHVEQGDNECQGIWDRFEHGAGESDRRGASEGSGRRKEVGVWKFPPHFGSTWARIKVSGCHGTMI